MLAPNDIEELKGENSRYAMVIGVAKRARRIAEEAEENKVSVRAQGDGDKGQMTIAEFITFMKDLVAKEIEANKAQ